MRKIILMVGVAIFIFLAFSTYNVKKSVESGEQLSEIRDLYFPVLERVDANIVRLDKMEERFMQAAMIGETDMIDEASEFYKQADGVFGEMAKLYPARAADIAKLRSQFQQYKNLAASTSTALIKNKGEVDPQAAEKMNASLLALKEEIKNFRKTSYDNFVQTLLESQKTTRMSLYLGLIIGAMNLIFMGVLVFFIRNTVKMTAVIAEQNATLELRVAERTAQLSQKTHDINAMLNNMSLGVCTVVPGNRLHPEYSAYLSTIFGTSDLAGRDVMEALFSSSTLGVDSKDQIVVALGAIIGEDSMMFDFNSHLLATEMQIKGADGHNKILQMDWSPIKNDDDCVDKVLLIVQDVTHLRELELAAAHQKEELDLISQIIKISIGKFNDFIDSANKFVAENRKLIESAAGKDADVVSALFRNMHTIKGNARTYEFKLITDAAHAAEMEYDRLRKEADAEWNAEQMLQELDAVAAAIGRYVEINEDKLGRKGRASDLLTTRGAFISVDEITSLRKMTSELAAASSAETLATLQKVVGHLGLIPLQRLVSGAVDSMSSLAKELNKPTPSVEIVNGDIAFNNTFAEALKSSLMHIVRNSLDHGIEAPEQRVAAGKPEQGRISFTCVEHEGGKQLRIHDDGRGLALHKLYEKGVANGVFSNAEKPTPAEVAELIFQSGLSTASQVTQVSGRGVGMDAVRTFLQEQGGGVSVELDNPGSEFGFTPFTFVINLPQSAFSF